MLAHVLAHGLDVFLLKERELTFNLTDICCRHCPEIRFGAEIMGWESLPSMHGIVCMSTYR